MAAYDDPYVPGGPSRLTSYLDRASVQPGPSRLTRSLDQVTASRVSLLDRLSRGERVDPREIQQQDIQAVDSNTEFGKGLRRFGYSAEATTKAFAGQMLENVAPEAGRSLMRDAQETMANMPRNLAPEFNTFDEARAAGLRGLGSYAASALGEGLPSLAATGLGMMAGAGAGALVGRAGLGRIAGGVGTALPMESGEVALDIQNDPRALANTTPAERTALMLGRGGINAALETVVPEALVVPRLLGKAGRVAPGARAALSNVAATGLAGGVGEFGTEAAQDLTGQAALNIARGDPISNLDLGQAGEAGIRGALPGGVIGGVAGGVQSLFSNVGSAGSGDGSADQTKKRAANSTNEPWGWVSDFSKNIKDEFKVRTNSDAKQSVIIPTINQRKALLDSIANVNPILREKIFGEGVSESDRKQLASLIINQIAGEGMAYYSDENLQRDPQRQKFLSNWTASTGTDFRKVMQAAQEGLNKVDMRGLTEDEDLRQIEQQMPGAGMTQLGGQLSEADILDTASNIAEGSDRAEADGSLVEVDDERDLRVKTSILAGERSPFDEKAFRSTLVQDKYKNNPNTSVDVEIEVDPETLPEGVTLTNAQIANALGGKRVGLQEFQPYADDEVNADGPLKLRINPMSAAATARDEAFRDQFAPYIGAYGEAEGMSENARRGRAFSGVLGAMSENGIEIDPEALGLPAGDPVRFKVNVDLTKVKDSLIINRAGGKNVTLRDLKKESTKRLPGPAKRLFERIREDYTNEFATREQIEALADFIEQGAVGDIPEFTGRRSGGGSASNLSVLRKLSPDALRNMLDDVDIGREEFLNNITGRLEAVDTPDAEFEAAAKQSTLEYERATDRLTERRSGRTPATAPPIEKDLLEAQFTESLAAAKEPIRLEDIGNQINKAKSRLSGEAISRLREKYAAKMSDLLETQFTNSLWQSDANPNSVRDIGNQINKAKSRLSEEAISRLRKKYAARMYKLTSNRSEGDAADFAREFGYIDDYPEPAKKSVSSGENLPILPSEDAQKRFLEVIERIMGKRVRVQFEETLAGAAETMAVTRQERLDQLREIRRQLLADLRSNLLSKAQKDKIAKRIAKVEEEERKVDRDEAVLGIIRVATGRETQAGLAEHEAFHAAFRIFFTQEERRIITTAFTKSLTSRRLREIFKDEPEVLAAINRDPEEAAAYGFQIWARDPNALKLGNQVDNLYNKFFKWIRNLFGALTYEERAELLLNDLVSGRRAEQGTSPAAKILDKDRPWTERAQKYAKDVYSLLEKGYDVVFSGVYNRLADSGNPILAQIARAGYQPTGYEGGAGMVQRTIAETKRLSNKADLIFKNLSNEELKALHNAKIEGVRPQSKKLALLFDKLGEFFDEMYEYQVNAGINLGDRGTGGAYYPLTWDPEKVLKNKAEFIKMLESYPQLRETKATALEIWQNITEYIDRGEDLVSVMGANEEPSSASSRPRALNFISPADRQQYMVDSPVETVVQYIKQAVRRTEFVRAYGVNGAKLKALKAEAIETYGATQEDMALVNDYVDGLLGNKEIGMSRELKDLYGAVSVYQNIRLLPFSLLNSLIDPLGIAIRSNSMRDAWDVFAYSVKNLFRDWKSEYTPDQWEEIAVDYGIVERSGTSINTDNLYTGITLRGKSKKINDAFFKYNLLNGWIRSNTILAVKMAQRFMYRSSQNFFGEEQSTRYLEELGLKSDDIVLGPDGESILIDAESLIGAGKTKEEAEAAAERIRLATEQFVRQSLLNPTAAELPNWASNPYFMPVAHLKSFVFAFNRTIIDRVRNEAENDNFKPAIVAAAYVPGMIAATFLKDMASGFGEEPPYKKDWGVVDYIQEGVTKSGLTGTGQFFVDMQQDIQFGGRGYESIAGPTLDQLRQGLEVFTTGDSNDVTRFMVKSLPANPLYDQWLLP